MTYTVFNDIPPPAPARTICAANKGPQTALSRVMAAMCVGEYFVVKTMAERLAVTQRTHAFRPRKFAVRQFADGWRVWRVG